MAFRRFDLQPGVDVESSPFVFGDAFQINTSNLIRFYSGRVQKLGGWQHMTTQPFVGTCRGLHGWADIPGQPYLAVGTEQRLEVFINGMLQDITPVTSTTNPAVSFSTSIGSTAVTVTDAGAGSAVAGDWINLLTQVSVGGIVLFGFYQITALGGANQYIIQAASPATANVTNGGAVPSYTTANGQSTVNVTLANHGYVTGFGGTFNAAVSTTVATLVLSGLYAVTSVTNANTFVITATGTANASTTASENAGNARIQYLLPSGVAVNTGLTGFGAGDYGGGDYGGFSGGITTLLLRQWSLDHFGQDLIASPSKGKIYFWQPTTVVPAAVVSVNAPTASNAVFVMPQAEIIVAVGAEIGATQQPLLVRWCDAADFTDWIATATNQAGSFSVASGSGLVGGLAVGMGALLWTDLTLYTMTYIGFPLVFGFNPIATGCGLIAARAAGNVGGMVMWLGLNQFYRYMLGGGVEPIQCSVWDFFSNNADFTQTQQIHCATNVLFNEMAWHFPLDPASPLWSAAAPMGYVKYNYLENVWDYGLSSQYQRTAWAGQSPMGNPIGADLGGLLQQHEEGRDADGAAMQWSWQASYLPLADGEDSTFTDLLIPDFVTLGAPSFTPNLLITDYPNQPPTTVTCKAFDTGTYSLNYEARGRYLSVGFIAHDSDLGTWSRLGGILLRVAPDGRAS